MKNMHNVQLTTNHIMNQNNNMIIGDETLPFVVENYDIGHNDGVTFDINEICPIDIIKTTWKMKSNMSNSLNEMPSKIIQDNIKSLAFPLTVIASTSIAQGIFPANFKKSTITPIYKGKGKKDNVNSYRPISVTKFISKLLERIIKNQLNSHMESNKLFSRCQFGFREGLSTEMALANFQNIIMKNQNEKYVSVAIFIDLEKAFDCVEHTDVINELHGLNFSHNAIRWFRS
jgi:hypothetical protein